MAVLRTLTDRRRQAHFLTALLLLGCIGLTAWVWSLPQTLPAAQVWAERHAWAEAARRLAQVGGAAAATDGPALTDADLHAWRDANRAEFDRIARRAAEGYRDRYSYPGEDGQHHPYLGDSDSYYWLHFARKLLRSESVCDSEDAGRCLDAWGHAPVGAPLAYPHSLHIFSIAAIHRLINGLLSPGYPLSASAMLVPVIVAVLGVLPAFFLGRLLAGDLGGMVSAVSISLHPLFLQRSLGGDNDVWNLVLPLYMVWAVTAALSGNWPRRTIFAVLAGAAAGLHATVWQGWVFSYTVVVAGLIAYLLIQTIDALRVERSFWAWRHSGARRTTETLFVFYVAAGVVAGFTGVGESYLADPVKAFSALAEPLFGQSSAAASENLVWPDVLSTVRELQRPTLWTIAGVFGGRDFMLVGLVGLLIAYFPRDAWRIRHHGLLFLGVASYTLALSDPALGRAGGLVLVGLPPLASAVLSVLERRRPTPALGLAIIMLLWFLGALYLSYGGLRFVFFLAPAFGLALAAAIGRIHEWLRVLSDAWLSRYRALASAVSFLLLAMVLVVPISTGIKTARAYVPMMDDAWWDSLTALRERSDPRSIVTVWWDYGHWAKYVADRRVTADGTSLLTHLPHWVSKVLTSPDPNESLGVLRMLDCESDAMPLPEGVRGAYGRIKAAGRDDLAAYTIVSALTARNREQAAAYLTDRGFSDDSQRDILAATHCDPPEAYLVLTTDMLKKIRSLFALGRADPRAKALGDRLGTLSEDEARSWLTAEFGYTNTEASDLYRRVKKQNRRVPLQYLDSAWRPCRRSGGEGVLDCPFRFNSKGHSKTGMFRYRPGDRPEATFELDTTPTGGTDARSGPPGLLLLAGEDRLESLHFDDTPYRGMAVLVEPGKARILLGTPDVLRSTLVQLLLLDGQYAKHFRKVDERGAYPQERVSLWHIDWGQAAGGDEP